MESKQKTPILKANPRKASMDNINLDTDIDDKPSAALPEPLLLNNEDRFVVFPLQHNDLWKKYKEHIAVFWTPEEIDLSKDMKDWEGLNDGERHFIKNILGFFAGSDGIVMENLSLFLVRNIKK